MVFYSKISVGYLSILFNIYSTLESYLDSSFNLLINSYFEIDELLYIFLGLVIFKGIYKS